MSAKATVVAPANIALIKYWGMRDPEEVLPWHPSLSMTLSASVTRTTVEWTEGSGPDEIWLADEEGRLRQPDAGLLERAAAQLERLRQGAERQGRFRVATRNSFPTAAGIASSASGFAALTLATLAAVGRTMQAHELAALVRRSGSGSAVRSLLGGFVIWPGEAGDPASPPRGLAAADHWDLRDLVAVVDSAPKQVSSREGHLRAGSSPYFASRREQVPERLRRVGQAIENRRFEDLAEVVEEEAVDLHLIAMSSRPPIFYWRPATLAVMGRVKQLRAGGIQACFTIDAGPNVHVLCPPEAEAEVGEALQRMVGVQEVLRDRVGRGPFETEEHLF